MSAEHEPSITRRDLLKGGLAGSALLLGAYITGDFTLITTSTTTISERPPLPPGMARFEEAVAQEIEQGGFEPAYTTYQYPFEIRAFGDGRRLSPTDLKDTVSTVSRLHFGDHPSHPYPTNTYTEAFNKAERMARKGTIGPQIVNVIFEPDSNSCMEFNDGRSSPNLFVKKRLGKNGCIGNVGGLGMPDGGLSNNFENDGYKNIALMIVRFSDTTKQTTIANERFRLTPAENTRSVFAHELGHTLIGLGLEHPRKKFSLYEEEVADLVQESATRRFARPIAAE